MRQEPALVRVTDVRFHVRNVRTRMPFRYGSATVTRAPILHVAVDIVTSDGRRAWGAAADILPPRWFDKDPSRDFERNVADLVAGARNAARFYREQTERRFVTPFDLWLESADALVDQGAGLGLNRLTSNHGPSLLDRAIIDALGKADELSFRELLLLGRLGLQPQDVHRELGRLAWQPVFDVPATAELSIRHTVGLSDPVWDRDIPGAERLDDGLPQSLQAYVREQGSATSKSR